MGHMGGWSHPSSWSEGRLTPDKVVHVLGHSLHIPLGFVNPCQRHGFQVGHVMGLTETPSWGVPPPHAIPCDPPESHDMVQPPSPLLMGRGWLVPEDVGHVTAGQP